MKDHVVARTLMGGYDNFIHGLAFAGAHSNAGDGMSPQINNGKFAANAILDYMAKDKGAK